MASATAPTTDELWDLWQRTAEIHRFCSACWPRNGKYVALCGQRVNGVPLPEASTCEPCIQAERKRTACSGRCGL